MSSVLLHWIGHGLLLIVIVFLWPPGGAAREESGVESKESERQTPVRRSGERSARSAGTERRSAEKEKGVPENWEPLGYFNELTEHALIAAGLTPIEASEVQTHFSQFLKLHEKEAAKRIFLSVAESEPEGGVYVYRIPAEPERAGKLLEFLRGRLEESVGARRAEMFLSRMRGISYGSFGQCDVKLELSPNKHPFPPPGEEWSVRGELTDPETGKPAVGSFLGTSGDLRRYFGERIELPSWERAE